MEVCKDFFLAWCVLSVLGWWFADYLQESLVPGMTSPFALA